MSVAMGRPMRRTRERERSSPIATLVETIVVIAVVGFVAFVGYRLFGRELIAMVQTYQREVHSLSAEGASKPARAAVGAQGAARDARAQRPKPAAQSRLAQ